VSTNHDEANVRWTKYTNPAAQLAELIQERYKYRRKYVVKEIKQWGGVYQSKIRVLTVKAKAAAMTTLVWTPRRSPLFPAGLRSVAVLTGVETLTEREVVAAAAVTRAGVVASPAIVVGLMAEGVTEETEGVATGTVLLEPASGVETGTDAPESDGTLTGLDVSVGWAVDEGAGAEEDWTAGEDWIAGEASASEHTA